MIETAQEPKNFSCKLSFPGEVSISDSWQQINNLIDAAVKSGDAAAWRAFVAATRRQITLSIIRPLRRWGIPPQDVVDDLAQETYLKLCSDRGRQLQKFSLEHPDAIEGYIKTIALNVANDYVKAWRAKKRGGGEVGQVPEHIEAMAATHSPGSEGAINHEILMQEVDQCLDGSRDRTIFWLHYQHGMTANAIAALPTIDLTVKGVESALLRLTRQVRERLVELASQRESHSSKTGGFRS